VDDGSSRNDKGKSFSIEMMVYNILGSEVVTIVPKNQKGGNYEVIWDAGNYPSDIYLYRLSAMISSKSLK
jgi:hypothetical protein